MSLVRVQSKTIKVFLCFVFLCVPFETFATTINLQVNTSLGDTGMASSNNDVGRNVTVSGIISTGGHFVPGSHVSNDERTYAARFTSVTIPQGATISSATFTLTPFSTYTTGGTIKFHVSTQASDNAGVLTGSNGDLNITARPRSTADAGPWTQNSVTVNVEQSLNVTNIIQEIINRAGWVSGNAIVILVDTHADSSIGEWQEYNSYDDSTTKAPKLDITYTTASEPPPKVKFRGTVRIRGGNIRFR